MLPGVQEWIHKLEEGEGGRYIKYALAFLALLALAAVWHVREATNYAAVEAMDAAQLARNIAQGEGYTTDFIRPFSIALMQNKQGTGVSYVAEGHPDIANAPVYPGFLAGFMKILPFRWEIPPTPFWRYQPEVYIGLINQLLFFGAVFLVFKIASTLFDRAVGWLAAVLLAAAEVMWEFVTSGLSTMLLIVLFLLLCWVLVTIERHAREGTRTGRWFAGAALGVGAILGVMALTRYSMGWLAIPVAAFLAAIGAGQRVKLAVIPFVVMALMMAPWLYRNYTHSGQLFGTAGFEVYQGTQQFEGSALERSMPEELRRDLNQVELQDYTKKLVVNASRIIREQLPRLGGSWITGFFLVALLIPFRNPAISRFRYFVAGCIFVFVIVQALARGDLGEYSPRINGENLLVIISPLVFIYGAGLFLILLDQIEFPMPVLRNAAIVGFVLIMSLPLILRLLPPRIFAVNYPPYAPPLIQRLAGYFEPDELMMSDIPWAVAWYGNHPCVWTTLDTGTDPQDAFFRISDYQGEIKGLYLTQLTMDSKFLSDILKSKEGAWGRFVLDSIMRTNVPSGFPLRKAPPGLFPDQLFLSDQKRWD